MDISRQFINNPTRVWLAILLLGVGGLFALLNIGRLEDPAFTIKTAVIVTHYPGASAQQVEEEVTLPLENAIQQLPSLDNVSSISSSGLSQITVNIASRYHSNALPQIWDDLRRRVEPDIGDARQAGVTVTRIGEIRAGEGPPVFIGADGRPVDFAATGFRHF